MKPFVFLVLAFCIDAFADCEADPNSKEFSDGEVEIVSVSKSFAKCKKDKTFKDIKVLKGCEVKFKISNKALLKKIKQKEPVSLDGYTEDKQICGFKDGKKININYFDICCDTVWPPDCNDTKGVSYTNKEAERFSAEQAACAADIWNSITLVKK